MHKNNFMNLNTVKFESKLPDDSIIVTYTEDNIPLSYFTDDIWDFRNYISSYTQTTVIDFNFDKSLSKNSIYYLKLCLYYYINISAKNTASLSFKTILIKYRLLKKIVKICEKFNADFSNIEKNKFCLNAIIDSLSFDSKMNVGKYLNIFELITLTGSFYELDDFGFSNESLNRVRLLEKKSSKLPKQTILIPSNILSDFIRKSSEFFDNFNKIKDELIDFVSNERFYRRAPNGGVSVPYSSLKMSNKLSDYLSKYSIKIRPNIISHFLYIQSLGSAFISCFSGMRKGELSNLPYNCLEIIENSIDGKEVYILNGYTNKLTRVGLVACSWVTSKQIIPIIDALKAIVQIHKILIDVGYIEENNKNIPLKEYPLFPIFNQQKHPVGKHPLYAFPTLATATLSKNIYQLIQPIVFEENDLEELNNFNLLIDWQDEYELNVGQDWNFKYHQFRRSLAVYCSRSSIVKLPALKKQLKHISFDMTLYYSNNYHNAKNINFDSEFINSYQNELDILKFNSFCENVIDNKSILFGAKGTSHEILRSSDDIPIFYTDRKITQKYIKDGRISYKKTHLGGCAKTDKCNKLSFAYATACVTCSEAIFDDNSVIALEKAKANYEKQLSKFDKDSIPYKQFLIEIEAIDNVLTKRSNLEKSNV